MITIRLFAAARAAAGTSELQVPTGSMAEVVALLLARSPLELATVLPHCALVVEGARLGPASSSSLPEGAVVDVLPPFAGG